MLHRVALSKCNPLRVVCTKCLFRMLQSTQVIFILFIDWLIIFQISVTHTARISGSFLFRAVDKVVLFSSLVKCVITFL